MRSFIKVQFVTLYLTLLLVSKTYSAGHSTDEEISAGLTCEEQYSIFIQHIKKSKEKVNSHKLLFEYIKLCRDEARSKIKETCQFIPKIEELKAKIASDLETGEQFKLLEEKCKGVSKKTLDEVGLLIEEERIQEQTNNSGQNLPSNNLKMGRQLKSVKRIFKAIKSVVLSTICLGASPLLWTLAYFRAVYNIIQPTGDDSIEGLRKMIGVPVVVIFGIPVVPVFTLVSCIDDPWSVTDYIRDKKK